jgi:non-ribosomal peptide synthetase component F
LAGKWFATDASEKQAVSSCIHQSSGWRIFFVWLTEGQRVKIHLANMLDLNQWIECLLKPCLMIWVQCLMCNICQITPKVQSCWWWHWRLPKSVIFKCWE